MSGRRASGFTLVEVMIVVLIIGLVAAIAVPHFAKARRQVRINKMLADLRVIYDAFGMYAMDNNGFPGAWGDVPEPVTLYLEKAKWDRPTAMGGDWLYYSAFGTYLLVVDDFNVSPGSNPIADQEEWAVVDKRIDDGNLWSGTFRFVAGVQMQYSLDETAW